MASGITYAYITRTPGVCGGKPCIEGHRVRVQDVVVEHEWQGLSPAEICREHPGVTLAQVHAALAYYYDHHNEIHSEIEAERLVAEDFQRNHPQWVR
jgi:uncharacterized protein (DUF433 family)